MFRLAHRRPATLTAGAVAALALAVSLPAYALARSAGPTSPIEAASATQSEFGSITEAGRWPSREPIATWEDIDVQESQVLLTRRSGISLYDTSGAFLGATSTVGDPLSNYLVSSAIAPNGSTFAQSKNEIGRGGLGWVQIVDSVTTEKTYWEVDGFVPMGLDYASDGTLFAADYNQDVVRTWLPSGQAGPVIGSPGSGPAQLMRPIDVAIGNDSVYVLDSGNFRVQRFRLDGTYLGSWGAEGLGAGQLSAPTSLTVAPSGNVYVLSVPGSGNATVDGFAADGTFIAKASVPVTRATGIGVDPTGILYVPGLLAFPTGEGDGVLKFTLNPAPAPTPTPTSTPTPPSAQTGTVTKKALKLKKKRIGLNISCPATATMGCAAKARLALRKGSKAGKALTRSVSYKITAGKTKTLKLKVTKTGLKLLRKQRATKAFAILSAEAAPSVRTKVKVKR